MGRYDFKTCVHYQHLATRDVYRLVMYVSPARPDIGRGLRVDLSVGMRSTREPQSWSTQRSETGTVAVNDGNLVAVNDGNFDVYSMLFSYLY